MGCVSRLRYLAGGAAKPNDFKGRPAMRKVSRKELRLKGIALLVLSCDATVCRKKA